MALTLSKTLVLILICVLGAVHAKIYDVNEDAQNGTFIFILNCTRSSSSPPQLSFQGNGTQLRNGWFEIRPRPRTNKQWDLLTGRNFSSMPNSGLDFNFNCQGDHFANPFTLNLVAVNKHPPYFCNNSSFVLDIAENQAVGEDIHSFKICDRDRRVIAKASVTPTSHFTLRQDGDMQNLRLTKQYDYDSMLSPIVDCVITVEDPDTQSPIKSTQLAFKVNITDVDDQGPAFEKPLYNCNIDEGHHPSDTVCAVKAEDQDKGLNKPINYSIISVVPSTKIFSIVSTGEILASGDLDREKISSYAVIIKGFQQDKPNDRYNHTTVVIAIDDIDDNPPVMSQGTYRKSIMENTDNGVAVLQVAATDPDQGENGKFWFEIIQDPRKAFSINSTTGVIAVRNSTLLDYDDPRAKVFRVQVHAVPVNKKQKASLWSQVIISLIDENDNAPKFEKGPYIFNISKNWNISSSVGQITATDFDTGTQLSYHLVTQTEAVPFSINSQTGSLTVSGDLVKNYKPVYNLTVMAEDGPHSLATTRRSTAHITVNVKDVNMFWPVFDQGIDKKILNISEATSIGTIILDLRATDKDTFDVLHYKISGGNVDDSFGLQNDRRQLYVKKELDREITPEYHLTVQVTDGPHTTSATVNIKIIDENDCDPEFQQLPYHFTITEEEPSGTHVGNVSAIDHDTGENAMVHYRLAQGYLSDNFTINNDTGEIRTNGKIDRELVFTPSDVIELVVIATDSGTPPRSTSARVSVKVQDINDNKPVLKESIVNITRPEGFGPGVIHRIQAFDSDIGINKELNYTYLIAFSNMDPKYVSILPDGRVNITEPLQITDKNVFYFGVLIRNKVGYSHGVVGGNVIQKIYLTIEDVNNHVPKLMDSSVSIPLPENYATGKFIKRIQATDDDFTPKYNTITYWIDPADDHFGIDSATGDLFLTKELDYENQTSHTFKVYASDMHPSSVNSTVANVSIPVTVHVTDVNDCTPEFINGPYNCSVVENSPVSQPIQHCTVQAIDGDKTRANNQIHYTVNNSQIFIVSETGAISLKRSLNYEDPSAPHTFILQVVAKDNGKPTLSSLTTVTVHLLNENDNAPKFEHSTYHFDVPENNDTPQLLKVIQVIDDDGDKLTCGCDNKNFTFVNGLLKVVSVLDYETMPTINFTIWANDGRNTTTAKVYIRVKPVNEFAPVIHLNDSDVDVTENTNRTFQFKVTDDDHGEDGKTSLEVRVAKQWKFHIICTKSLLDPLATCSIFELDREKVESIEMLLVATDHGSPSRTAAISKTVRVTGVNDNAPYFLDHVQNVTVVEGVAKRDIYRAHAKDNDTGAGSDIQYRLKSPHSTLFSISVDGIVSVGALEINSTNNGRYILEIEASNGQPYQDCSRCRDGSQTLIVNIQDVNNHSPHFLNYSVVKTVSEDTPLGSVITRVIAKDDDFTEEFNTVIYSVQPPNDHFHIDTSSGFVYLTNNLDYENQTQRSLTFKVYASDMKLNVKTKRIETTNLTVTIKVSDVNDNAPQFMIGPYNCSVLEEYKGVIDKCSVTAVDIDSGAYGHVTYTVTNNQKLFTVTGSGQLSLNKALDYDKPGSQHVYRIQVKASDGGTPPKTALTTVTIHLLNKNDNPPVFNKSSYNFDIRENNTIGQLLQPDRIFATDTDGDPLQYTISNPNFALVDGFLRVDTVLDFEAQNKTMLVINVTDGHFTDTCTVTVNILPVNEFNPRFIMKTYGKMGFVRMENNTVEVSEGSGSRYLTSICVDTEDLDAGLDGERNYTYHLPNKWNSVFSCTEVHNRYCKLSCHIFGKIDRDIDDNNIIPIQFNIQDHGTPPRYGRTTLYVKVNGINDNSPQFAEPVKTFTIKEGVPQKKLYDAQASDGDKGTGSKIFFRLKGGSTSLFSVSPNGTVSTEALWIDSRNKGTYSFTVEAYNVETLANCTQPDPCINGQQRVVIYLQDANNHAPTFAKAVHNIKLSENLPTGSNLTRIVATDADTTLAYNTIRYWLEDSYNGTFRIDTNTGDIYLEKSVNFDPPDNQKSFTLLIYATDLETRDVHSNHTASTRLQITVEDYNDNSPKFDKELYQCSTKENTTTDFGCRVGASDVEDGTNLVYTLVNASSSVFKVNLKTGVIGLKQALDFERSAHQFSIIVKATDRGKPHKESSCTVEIKLLNINDESPEFVGGPYIFSLYENTKPNISSIGDIVVRDVDGDNVTVTIQGDNSDFRLSNKLELIPVKSFNYENPAERVFHLTLQANDSVHTTTASVTVHVLDSNDEAPKFSNGSYSVSVMENVHISYKVIQVNATDADSTVNGNNLISYSIVDGGRGAFHINNKTGWITTGKKLNASVIETYTIVVQAADSGEPPLLSITTVTVHVNDTNDLKPWFLYTPYSGTVRENTEAIITKVYGKDPDPSTKNLDFQVVDKSMQQFFFFDKNILKSRTALDAEIVGLHVEVNISLSDGDKSHTVYEMVIVTVIDVNEFEPYFNNTPYNTSISDTAKAGDNVLTITASDRDVSNNDVTYALYGGQGDFIIDRKTGEITVAKHAELNYGRKSRYNMTVLVQDSGSPPKTNSTDVIVHLIETNAGPPVFTKTHYNFTFEENDKWVRNNVIAHDTDGVEYTIISHDDDDKFLLDKDTGMITLAHGIMLDYENRSDYSLIVKATDKATFNKSSTATITIKVKDINEAPEIMINPKNVFKEINSTKGAEVMQIGGSDPDTNPNFNNLTYSLKEDRPSYFAIDKVTGKITVNHRLAKTGNFSLNVTVSDGELTDCGLVFVFVSEIKGKSLNTTVHENQTVGSLVYDLEKAKHDINLTGLALEIQKDPGAENFKLKNNTTVVTAAVLDRETTPEFDLIINGKDTVNKIMKAQIQLHVTVLDVNDNPPNFIRQPYNFEIKEGMKVGTQVDTVTATDLDQDPVLSFAIVNGSEFFAISNGTGLTGVVTVKTGVVTVKKKIDRESLDRSWNDVIRLQVACFDGKSTATSAVNIKILDVNDNPPKFTQKNYTVSLLENHGRGDLSKPNITAIDKDTVNRGKLNFTIVNGNIGDHFSIGLRTGHLRLENELNYEIRTHYNLTIMVEDGIYNDTAAVYVQVVDVNDNPPQFQNSSYSFYTLEGPSSLGKRFSVMAIDKDSGNNSLLSYSFSEDDAKTVGSYFKMHTENNQGIIEVTTELDRDHSLLPQENLTGSVFYTFTVVAKDHGLPQQKGTAKVTVYVTDINDCPPKFMETNITRDVQESSLPRYHIVTMTTSDCDFNPNFKTVTYWLNGTGKDHFTISKTGEIILSKPVSLQEQATYDLVVSAFDGNNTAYAHLWINVIDTNDHSPNFTEAIYNFEVSEAADPGMVGHVSATDDDIRENGRVTYKITSGDGMGVFDIDAENGTIKLTGQLNREKKDSYTLFITATDHAQRDKPRSGNCEVRITVLDENDNSPVFHSSDVYSAVIREDSGYKAQLHVVPKINATDNDAGDNGTAGIRYSLTGDGSQLFCIDQVTAVIELCQAPLDRETVPYYHLQIIAKDRNGSSLGHNTTASLNITVMDVNDNIPQFNGSYSFDVPENTNTTTSVGQVWATDADLPSSNKIRYAIRSGGMGQFYIDPVTGSIHVSGALDRERQDSYFLNVTVTDGKADHVNWTIVNITIQDVNDCRPEFDQPVLKVEVYEGQGAMVIGIDTAHDDDAANTENSRISFYLKNDTETDSLFKISENGTLSTLQTLDRENKSSYTLTIIAKDHGKPQLSGQQTVRVTVLDINDNAPMFCDSEKGCSAEIKERHSSIVEESPQNSVAALLVAKDDDDGNNKTIVYSLQGDARALQFFSINSRTGIVKLAQPVNLNRLVELGLLAKNGTDNATLIVTVVAADQGTPTSKSTKLKLIVSVMGINDQAPQFKKPVFSFNVSEDFNVGDIIGETGAIVNSSSLHMSYAKVSRIGNEKFKILEQSGAIQLASSLDRELESYYTFPILVRDGGIPERTAYAAVEIHVLDCNDNYPVFLKDSYEFNIPENMTWSGVMNISATDRDEGLNAALVYSLQDDFGNLLSIDNSSGLVSVHQELDREFNDTITYTVLVKDKGSPSLGSNVTVTIHVLDVNDNAPTFYSSPTIVRIKENNISESFEVHATDPDAGLNGTVIFELSDEDTGPFQINPFSGKVTLLEPLDYELVRKYNLTIQALDQGQPSQSTIHNVKVTVEDMYDFVPKCEPEIIEKTVKSSVPISTEIAQVHAGKGNLTYRLTGGSADLFSVDKLNGQITTDRYLGKQTTLYELSVMATDEITYKTDTCKVIIHIEDSSSSFPMPFYNVSIRENLNLTLGPYLLIDLNATEERTGGHVTYTLSGTDPKVTSRFWIDPVNGRVFCNATLDREETGSYELYITAHSVPGRQKRDTGSTELGTVKLTVIVEDVNDCPPSFTEDQKQNKIFGVPSSAKANYLVTTLKTHDDDVNSKTLYKVIDGDMTTFGVDGETGELKTLASVAKSRKKQFELTVMALDQDIPTLNDTISLKIYTVDPGEQLMLTANMSITDFTKKSYNLISEMGNILGVKVQLEYSTPHKQPDGSVDLKTTDIFFHGLNKTTNNIIPYDKMLDLMKRNEAKLKELFNMRLLEVDKVPVDHYLDPSQITASQIALICMAVLIFFGSLFGIVLTMYSWQRLEDSEETDKKRNEKIYSQIELESLRSRHSNRPDVSAAFINPSYTETVIGSADSSLAKKKQGVQYESQELRMTFREEIQGGIVLHNGPVHRDNGSYSMADSGVDNLSQHSSDQHRPGSTSGQSGNRGDNHDRNVTGVAMVTDVTRVAMVTDEKMAGTNEHGVRKLKESDTDNISRVSKVPKSTVEAPAPKFLNVEEAPMMTSTPYQSHTDISSHGTAEVILDQEHDRSNTESTTDILDGETIIPGADGNLNGYANVQDAKQEKGYVIKVDENGYAHLHNVRKEVNEANIAVKEETDKESIAKSMDTNDNRKDKANDYDQIDEAAVGEEQSRAITLHGGDDEVTYRERTLTLSFEEIGETNDEDESTQF